MVMKSMSLWYNLSYSFWFCRSLFLREVPCYFQYFNFTQYSNVTFQTLDVLQFVKPLCRAFTNFDVKNVCILMSGCNFKLGAQTQVFEKSTHFYQTSYLLYPIISKDDNFGKIMASKLRRA